MRFLKLHLPAAGLAAVLALAAGGASAGQYSGDRIHADSFGNLIVHSRSGFKRIVVGQGHLAEELIAYQRGGEVVTDRAVRHCYSKPTFWRGRSRMYGLEDGEIPQPRVICD